MKNYGLLGFIGFIGLSAVLAVPARAEDAPHVYISEINWAGSEISTADEWIELVNLDNIAVDLSYYVLTGTATSGGAIEIAEGTVIQPGQAMVIANYALGDPKTTLSITPNLVTSALSLPNSGLNILLATPTGLVIDSYIDTGVPDFGLTDPATSMERDLRNLTWQSSPQNLGLLSTSQFGTPGSIVLPVIANPTPVEAPVSEPDPVVIEPIIDQSPVVEPVPEPIAVPEPETALTPELNTNLVPEVVPEPVVADLIQPTVNVDSSAPIQAESTTIYLNETPAIEPVAPTLNTSSIQKIESGQLILNELVSDPTDGVEWVEIMNSSSRMIDLTGSTLVDAGEHVTALPSIQLSPDQLLVIDNPNGNLNNTTETITLFDSYGAALDTLTYGTTEIPAAQDGESLARNSAGDWLITSATRNTPNVFITPTVTEPAAETNPIPTANDTYDTVSTIPYETLTNEPDPTVIDPGTASGAVETTNNSGSTGTEPIHRIVAIAKPVDTSGLSPVASRKSKKTEAQTIVTGTIVALPETFGKQIMFLDGYEIYFNAADWPTLALGDKVTITGTESKSDGAPRLKISSAEAIVVTGHADVTPTPASGHELAKLAHGSLVTITGRVVAKEGNELSVTTGDGTSITIIGNKRTGVSWSSIQSGQITVSGVVKQTDNGTMLAVRTNEDVNFTPDAPITSPTVGKTKTNASPLLGGGLLTGSIGALGTWYLRSRKGLLSWLPF